MQFRVRRSDRWGISVDFANVPAYAVRGIELVVRAGVGHDVREGVLEEAAAVVRSSVMMRCRWAQDRGAGARCSDSLRAFARGAILGSRPPQSVEKPDDPLLQAQRADGTLLPARFCLNQSLVPLDYVENVNQPRCVCVWGLVCM